MIATETSKDISVNGIRVTCYSDGSVESHGRSSQEDHSALMMEMGIGD